MFETSFPQLSRKPFIFFANMHQFHSDDAPPSELQATETFSQDCALSLSLRGCPQVMPELTFVHFISTGLGSTASHVLRSGPKEVLVIRLRSPLMMATSLVPCRKGEPPSRPGEPRVLLLRLRKKADNDRYLRLRKMAYNMCVTDHYSVEQVAASW